MTPHAAPALLLSVVLLVLVGGSAERVDDMKTLACKWFGHVTLSGSAFLSR
jgi:hypothetical protein